VQEDKERLMSATREQRSDVSYQWSTGGAVGAFLSTLRDSERLLGSVCPGCGVVCCPPASCCERCGTTASELKEVGPSGVVMAVARQIAGFSSAPLDVPFLYVLIKLAGADTTLLHVAKDDDRIVPGAVVVPQFAPEKRGTIMDIAYFRPEEG
jgi:uncharacterized protein